MVPRWVYVLAALILAVAFFGSGSDKADPSRPAQSDRFVDLRDEGIRNVGWVAGNARGHPVWPQLREFVEPGGSYHDGFVRLWSGRRSQASEAAANVALYNEWVRRGENQPFNEREAMSRIQRMQEIAVELKSLIVAR